MKIIWFLNQVWRNLCNLLWKTNSGCLALTCYCQNSWNTTIIARMSCQVYRNLSESRKLSLLVMWLLFKCLLSSFYCFNPLPTGYFRCFMLKMKEFSWSIYLFSRRSLISRTWTLWNLFFLFEVCIKLLVNGCLHYWKWLIIDYITFVRCHLTLGLLHQGCHWCWS